jgi:hypothetical protein
MHTHWLVATSLSKKVPPSQVVQAEAEVQTRQPAWHILQGPGAMSWKYRCWQPVQLEGDRKQVEQPRSQTTQEVPMR